MFTIAICDNEKQDLELGKSLLEECLGAMQEVSQETYRITGYLDGRELIEQVEKGVWYDAYFLDVMMPQLDGITVGRLLREHQVRTPIVYTTYSRGYAFDAFRNQAMDYLQKPLEHDQVKEVLDRIWKNRELYYSKPYHINCRDRGMVVVKLNDIMYVENVSRSAVFHMRDGSVISSVSIRTTFEDTLGSLPSDPNFLQPHKTFLVNMQYIRMMHGERMEMDDGRVIPMSRERCPKIRKIYLDYVANKEV